MCEGKGPKISFFSPATIFFLGFPLVEFWKHRNVVMCMHIWSSGCHVLRLEEDCSVGGQN